MPDREFLFFSKKQPPKPHRQHLFFVFADRKEIYHLSEKKHNCINFSTNRLPDYQDECLACLTCWVEKDALDQWQSGVPSG